MHPAFSILFFTTLAGAAQGLVVLLALSSLGRVPLAPNFVLMALHVAEVLMWRTSWMSREVIVLPAFITLVAIWWFSIRAFAKMPTPIATPLPGQWSWLLPALVLAGALALWYCTAMIYACLRFIEEWAHPLTIVNFTLIGLSSGMVLGCALAALAGDVVLIQSSGLGAIVITLVAWAVRGVALRRNAGIKHKSTLQSATGIQSPKLVQKAMGMSAGAFNTREFFHGAKAVTVRNVKVGFQVLAFGLPVLLMVWGLLSHTGLPWVLAMLVQAPGLIAERWFFFAQAKHPQNLYYQVVS
jgi:DMSO reductase anchor subunit